MCIRDSSAPDWNALFSTFEAFRHTHLNGKSGINRIRAEISDTCLAEASAAPGIVTLSVPTGGGKTYASLRYALRHAAEHGQRRIFYIIPYNTILDQNAADIRAALNNYPSILEHHANVVLASEEEQLAYRQLTERWDSDIILTSLVQSIFMAENLIPVLSYYTLYFTTGKRFRIAPFSFGILLHSIARNSEVASRSAHPPALIPRFI